MAESESALSSYTESESEEEIVNTLKRRQDGKSIKLGGNKRKITANASNPEAGGTKRYTSRADG